MRFTSCLFVALLGLSQIANAGIVFKLAPNNQSAYPGTTLGFTLTLASDLPGGNNVNSVDVNVNAGGGGGAQGVFVSPTNQTNTLAFGGPPDFSSTPGQVFINANSAGPNVAVSQTGFLLANLFLNTTGVTPGNYTLTLDSLAANDAVNGGLGVTGSTVSYQILAAVPEPTSLLTAATLGFSGLFYRRRRAKRAMLK